MAEPLNVIESRLASRQNAIGFMRFFLAMDVLWKHAIELGGWTSPFWQTVGKATSFAPVDGFFFLSGLLVARSWMRTTDWRKFVRARAYRLLPGYWVCLLATALVIGPLACLVRLGGVGEYFGRVSGASWIKYPLWNAPLVYQRQGGIVPLFEGNPVPVAVNASLWTLPWEALGYLTIFLLGLAGLLRRESRLVLGATVALYAFWLARHYEAIPQVHLPVLSQFNDIRGARMMLLYLLGTSTYLYADRLKPAAWHFWVAFPLGMAALLVPPLAPAGPLLYAYAVLCASLFGPFPRFDHKADLSYGIYIYAFPIQQALVWVGATRYGLAPFLAATLALVLPLAWLSWTYVERPALKWKPRPTQPS